MNNLALKIESPDQVRLMEAFQEMAQKDKRSILISAFRKSTKPTLNAVRANVHTKTRNLYKSIGLIVLRNEVGVVLGARTKGGFKGFHGHLVEAGTNSRGYVAKKTIHIKTSNGWFSVKEGERVRTGRMNENKSYGKYFQRGVESTNQESLNILTSEWANAIERFHRKHGLK
jgi:hypothetical protein